MMQRSSAYHARPQRRSPGRGQGFCRLREAQAHPPDRRGARPAPAARPAPISRPRPPAAAGPSGLRGAGPCRGEPPQQSRPAGCCHQPCGQG